MPALPAPPLEWMGRCCGCTGLVDHAGHGELKVYFSGDRGDIQDRPHSLSHRDPLDITYSPRDCADEAGFYGFESQCVATPRQKDLWSNLELPQMPSYPWPPNACMSDTAEDAKAKLQAMYREFAMELHTGMYMTQATSSEVDMYDHETHCQLMDDLVTLKLDRATGRIVEFPLTSVSSIYEVVKVGNKWYAASHAPAGTPVTSEHIVVVEFWKRRLAFVFQDLAASQRFSLCMDLLVQRAQQRQAAASGADSLPPHFPPQVPGALCPTPRQLREACARPSEGPDVAS